MIIFIYIFDDFPIFWEFLLYFFFAKKVSLVSQWLLYKDKPKKKNMNVLKIKKLKDVHI